MGKQRAIAKAVLLFLVTGMIADFVLRSHFIKSTSLFRASLERLILYLIYFLIIRYLVVKNEWLVKRITSRSKIKNDDELRFSKLAITLSAVFSGIYILLDLINANYALFLLETIGNSKNNIQNLINNKALFDFHELYIFFSFFDQTLLLFLAIMLIFAPVFIANKIINIEKSSKRRKNQ